MSKKSIGLFFGSFNPVHLGHVQLAQHLLTHTTLNELWMVVSPNNPLKNANGLIDEHLRLQMLRLAIAHFPNIYASEVEFNMPRPSYTANTLRVLSKQYPDKQFTLIIGADNMIIFDQWHEYQFILNNYPILVYPRIGNNCADFTTKYPQMHLIEAPLFPISSTQIRSLLAQKKDATQWLHPDVWQFIQHNKLYGCSTTDLSIS